MATENEYEMLFARNAAPRPWRIDKDNAEGIEIVADNGDLVAIEDYRSIPDERGAAFREMIVNQTRSNFRLIVLAVNAYERK